MTILEPCLTLPNLNLHDNLPAAPPVDRPKRRRGVVRAKGDEAMIVRPLAPVSRTWAMPSRWTFTIKPIQALIRKYKLPGQTWIDPMAGFYSPCEVKNDINPDTPCEFHMPALEFLTSQATTYDFDTCEEHPRQVDGALFDPPYSIHQVKVAYDSHGLSLRSNITGGFPKEKDVLASIIKPGGIVISFGWNTTGMGKGRGFAGVEYLMVEHGGNRNSTLCSVEVKL